MIRRLHAFALAALLAAPSLAAAQRETTVILVRHAEKVTSDPRDPNPALTPAGTQRAADLAEYLRRRHVAGVITTQFARTSLTGKPTADAAHVALDSVLAGRDVQAHAAAVAELVRTKYAGKTVLVVGHSNTVPKIIAALGGPTLADICDAAHSNLFTLVIPPTGAPRFTHTHYGAADPAGGPECADGIVVPRPAAAAQP
jgi:phosphohistidine phosphatase SixA